MTHFEGNQIAIFCRMNDPVRRLEMTCIDKDDKQIQPIEEINLPAEVYVVFNRRTNLDNIKTCTCVADNEKSQTFTISLKGVSKINEWVPSAQAFILIFICLVFTLLHTM